MPLCGKQSLDKERDIRGIESNAHVPNNGLTQVQLMEGKDFITSGQRESLSPFCEYWCPYQEQISLFPKMVTLLARIKDPFSQLTFIFLTHGHSTCRVQIQPRQRSPCLDWFTIQNSLFDLVFCYLFY